MSSNFDKFDFDLGIGSSNRSSKSLNDQRNNSNSNSYSYSYSTPASKTMPAWTHQPAPSQPGMTRSELGGPASMVGDITGKNWNSTPPKVAVASSIGIVNKNPNLFGDLVNSALGQNKINSNVPLKNSTPVNNAFSMGSVSNSLPKPSNVGVGSGSGLGGQSLRSGISSNVGVGTGSGLRSGTSSNVGVGTGTGSGLRSGITSNVGVGPGSGLRSGTTSNVGVGTGSGFRSGTSSNVGVGTGSGLGLGGQSLGNGMGSKKDPFGSFVDFSSKPMKNNDKFGQEFDFGGFQNASKPNMNSNPSSVPKMSTGGGFGGGGGDSFDVLFPSGNSNSNPSSVPKMSTGDDSFDVFFPSVPASVGGNVVEESGGDEWGFEGGHEDGNTTELDGLPPPPAGVSASTAKGKGLDNYKQGQYADAIKWLSWAEVLLEKSGYGVGSTEVLSCRASCYKEVGEYKKAVADCTKVLNNDEKNVAVLVQRALLYESMEKYRLGADDLRTVMKLDPGNRVARSTIHRLNKMAD